MVQIGKAVPYKYVNKLRGSCLNRIVVSPRESENLSVPEGRGPPLDKSYRRTAVMKRLKGYRTPLLPQAPHIAGFGRVTHDRSNLHRANAYCS